MSCAAVDVVVHAQRVTIVHGMGEKGALLHALEGKTEAAVKYVAESRVLVCTFDTKSMQGLRTASSESSRALRACRHRKTSRSPF